VSHADLNLKWIEARMADIVIDLHDAARLGEAEDIGVAVALRNIAHELNELIQHMRRLLPSTMDSGFGGLE
jgi:hypothetical protein